MQNASTSDANEFPQIAHHQSTPPPRNPYDMGIRSRVAQVGRGSEGVTANSLKLILNVASWLPRSRANGPGTRMVLWLQGCPFRCPGCQNPDYLEFRLNHIVTVERVCQVFQQLPDLTGISFSGGEPFAQAVALADLAKWVQASGKTVVCWTGYRIEQLQLGNIPGSTKLLHHIDLLIDGLFISEQADDSVLRGSSNQKLHFLSGRITEADLVAIPRQEWMVTPETVTYTGFPT